MSTHLTHVLILAEHLRSLSAASTSSQLKESTLSGNFDLKLIAVKTRHLLKQKSGPFLSLPFLCCPRVGDSMLALADIAIIRGQGIESTRMSSSVYLLCIYPI